MTCRCCPPVASTKLSCRLLPPWLSAAAAFTSAGLTDESFQHGASLNHCPVEAAFYWDNATGDHGISERRLCSQRRWTPVSAGIPFHVLFRIKRDTRTAIDIVVYRTSKYERRTFRSMPSYRNGIVSRGSPCTHSSSSLFAETTTFAVILRKLQKTFSGCGRGAEGGAGCLRARVSRRVRQVISGAWRRSEQKTEECSNRVFRFYLTSICI